MAEEEKKEEETESSEEEVEVPENLENLVEEIEEMKVADLAKLVEVLEDRLGVSAAPVAAAPAAPAGGDSGEEEEKSAYDVIITSPGDEKISVIKAVKKITQKGLKNCKDMVDAAESDPQTVKQNVETEEAEDMKKQLEEAGATVELK